MLDFYYHVESLLQCRQDVVKINQDNTAFAAKWLLQSTICDLRLVATGEHANPGVHHQAVEGELKMQAERFFVQLRVPLRIVLSCLQAQCLCLYFEGLPHRLVVGVEAYPLSNLYWCCRGICLEVLCKIREGPVFTCALTLVSLGA